LTCFVPLELQGPLFWRTRALLLLSSTSTFLRASVLEVPGVEEEEEEKGEASCRSKMLPLSLSLLTAPASFFLI
jgi:hypothetical protein